MRLVFMSMFSLVSFLISDCKVQNSSTTPCFTDREVVESISEVEMRCKGMGDSLLLIEETGSKRYVICNAEDYTIEDGKKYTVSGKLYEIKPNERWPGTPFQITAIKN